MKRQSAVDLTIVMIITGSFIGCVDKIEFDLPSPQSQLLIEGMISDKSGSYVVRLTEGLDLNADTVVVTPVPNASVTLFDDLGNSELMAERSPGYYYSSGTIKGAVGRSYHVKVATSDGSIFESEPDLLKPVGDINSIRYEFDPRLKEEKFGFVRDDFFNVIVDGDAVPGDDNYVRWRFTGTYKVLTYPGFRYVYLSGYQLWQPFPCSGFIVIGGDQYDPNPTPVYPGPQPVPIAEGKLSKVADCACCVCYVNQYESIPQLSDNQLITNSGFKNVTVAQIPINTETFYEKYYVEVEQMSMSKAAFNFFKLIKSQKDGAGSLFQPPSGELRGNFKSTNSSRPVVGIFWATSIKSKSMIINRSDVPYSLSGIRFIPFPCDTYFGSASTTKPAFW